MDASRLPYLMAFNCLYKLKASDVSAICAYFQDDIAAAWAHPQEWRTAASLTIGQAEIDKQWRGIYPELLYREFVNSGFKVCALGDDDYPQLLAQIFDPPLLLFYQGQLPQKDDLCLAMIGSRQASPYGYQVAEILARDLAQQGITIVSGLARGIDSVCHKACLAAGGLTLAVLGCGLDVVYPREHERLYAQIGSHGAVLSEFPLGTPALAHNFPRRNRIISGLCQGLIVIEAGERSGCLHTVNYALEQGRDVFACLVRS